MHIGPGYLKDVMNMGAPVAPPPATAAQLLSLTAPRTIRVSEVAQLQAMGEVAFGAIRNRLPTAALAPIAAAFEALRNAGNAVVNAVPKDKLNPSYPLPAANYLAVLTNYWTVLENEARKIGMQPDLNPTRTLLAAAVKRHNIVAASAAAQQSQVMPASGEPKTKTPTWVWVTLGVVGATAIGLGIAFVMKGRVNLGELPEAA